MLGGRSGAHEPASGGARDSRLHGGCSAEHAARGRLRSWRIAQLAHRCRAQQPGPQASRGQGVGEQQREGTADSRKLRGGCAAVDRPASAASV